MKTKKIQIVEKRNPKARISSDLISHMTKMARMRMRPNFFVSIPYLNFFGAKVIKQGWNEWIEIDGEALFPPIILSQKREYPVNHIWTDFLNKKPFGAGWKSTPFDLEYLYNPQDFNFMNGGKWNTFRKNVRKWPRENTGWEYNIVKTPSTSEVENVLGEWLEKRQDNLQDPEFIIHCVLDKPEGIHHQYLWDGSGKLAAINVFDVNYAFINYRFVICRDDKFLDEFARFLFYRDDMIQLSGMLVNDGGVLDNPGLERFKDKLNPVCKRTVKTWNKS